MYSKSKESTCRVHLWNANCRSKKIKTKEKYFSVISSVEAQKWFELFTQDERKSNLYSSNKSFGFSNFACVFISNHKD